MNVRNVALCAIVEADLGDLWSGLNDRAVPIGIGIVKDLNDGLACPLRQALMFDYLFHR